jgi:hypothetical protein
MLFAYFAEYLAISKEDCEISLVSFDTNEYTLAPPLVSTRGRLGYAICSCFLAAEGVSLFSGHKAMLT